MKICQILAGNEEGGLEKHFEELCNQISHHHQVHVIAHEKYRNRFASSIIFHPLDLSKSRKNIFMLYMLFRTINSINPDIVHAHANKAVDMVASIRYFLHSSIKTIATLHSKKRKLTSFEKFNHVIGVSHEVLKGLKNPHKDVVYNGIQFQLLKKDPSYLSQFGVNKDQFLICAVGRLEVVKNFSLLIHAIKNFDVKLLIVGEGSQKEKLLALVHSLSLEDKVIFTGFRKDVQQIINNVNLCVISSDKEGFSYVMAEALLLRTPIVSTDVADMKQILPPSYIVPINDLYHLTRIIQYVQEHYTDVLMNFEESFEFAQKHFTLNVMINDTLKIYEKVIL